MTVRRLSLILGLLSLVICCAAWMLDLTEFVVQCIYCRNERTIIGLLGVLLLLPACAYITRYLGLVFGFYGASVSAQHIMLIMNHGNFSSLQLPFSIAALFIMIGQVCFIFSLRASKGSVIQAS